jgi:hypothetical protein
MKKLLRLTESDLIRIVKQVISEQSQDRKKFKIGSNTYQIQKITPVDNMWNQLEYVKVLSNGMMEKRLITGFIKNDNSKFIYQTKNDKSQKIGPSDVELVVVRPNQNVKPQNQPDNKPQTQSQPTVSQKDINELKNFYKNLTDYLNDFSGEYKTKPENSTESNKINFKLFSSENRNVGGLVTLSSESGKIKVLFGGTPIYNTEPNDPRGIALTSSRLVKELFKQQNY